MGITVAVCVDDEMGMMFNSRRQSRDRVLIEELISSTKGKIYIHPYSKTLFGDSERVVISDDPLTECEEGGVVFVENLPILPHKAKIERLVIYRWNRAYPADVYLDIPLEGFRMISKSKFVGSSHDKITKEIYL